MSEPKNVSTLLGCQGVRKVTLKLGDKVIYEGPGNFAEKDFELPEVSPGEENIEVK